MRAVALPRDGLLALATATLERRRRASRVADSRLLHRLAVEEIPPRLRQQEDVLMRLGAAVFHALWHRVGLRPANRLAQNPSIGLQRHCHKMRDV